MKIYQQFGKENIGAAITRSVEDATGKTIFTLRIMEEVKDGLETFIVFEDKSILLALISIEEIKGELAARIKGNYI